MAKYSYLIFSKLHLQNFVGNAEGLATKNTFMFTVIERSIVHLITLVVLLPLGYHLVGGLPLIFIIRKKL